MKKIAILVAAFMLATAPAFSQIIPGAGYLNSSFISGSSSSAQNGFYAGVSMDMNISGVKGLSFAPGAYVSYLSSSSSSSFLGLINTSGNVTEIDLNIPAHAFEYLQFNPGDYQADEVLTDSRQRLAITHEQPLRLDVPPCGGLVLRVKL